MGCSSTNGPRLTPSQAAAYAYNHGFRGRALVTIVAIAFGETGGTLATWSRNTCNNVAGQDQGLLQFNSHYHPEIATSGTEGQSLADDPDMAFGAAARATGGGTSFTDWTADFTPNQGLGGQSAVQYYWSQAQAAAAQFDPTAANTTPPPSPTGIGSAFSGSSGGTVIVPGGGSAGTAQASPLLDLNPVDALGNAYQSAVSNIPFIGNHWWANQIGGIVSSFAKTFWSPVEHKLAQGGWIVLGGVIVIAALVLLISDSDSGQAAVRAAGAAVA